MRRQLLVVPLLLALPACSGSDDPEPSVTPTPDATTAAPTAAPTPSPTPSASPTATAPARAVPAADKDVDGDGKADVITPSATSLVVRLSGSGRVVEAAVHQERPGAPEVLGTADVDRDGRAEVFLKTAEGASTAFATPYRYDGTSLREVTLDGTPARLGYGGGVTHGDGFRCLPTGQLEVRQATSTDGKTFTVQVTSYRLTGAALARAGSRTETGGQGSSAVQASYTADCGSVAG